MSKFPISIYMIHSLVLVFLLLSSIHWSFAQLRTEKKENNQNTLAESKTSETKKDTLDYSTNKNFPDIIADEVITALSHYPELVDVHIDFVFRKNIIKSFMQAQPKWYGVFQGKRSRRYVVKITPALKLKEKSIPVEKLPSDALVGWIGHELGHIMDYQTRSGFGLICFGVGYLTSEKYLKKAEQTADLFAINHNLGSEILSTKHYILDNAEIPMAYKERIRRLYMSPEEVMEHIDEDDSLLPIDADNNE